LIELAHIVVSRFAGLLRTTQALISPGGNRASTVVRINEGKGSNGCFLTDIYPFNWFWRIED